MTMPPDTSSPVSFVVHVARLPKNGMPVTIEADEAQREQLAEDHGLEAVDRYRADLLVAPWKSGGVRVTGKVEAQITQACIVTLDPIDATIDAEVFALFVPEDSRLTRPDHQPGGEIVLDAEGPDSPETFSGDSIDAGALAEQFFALSIDPYPRKPGAAMPSSRDTGALAEDRGQLFEKLKSLKPKP